MQIQPKVGPRAATTSPSFCSSRDLVSDVSSDGKFFLDRQQPNSQHPLFPLLGGCGKTRLAQSLKDRVTAQGGFYLTGKFDQFGRPEAYTAFVSAFTEFANLVMQQPQSDSTEETMDSIRHDIRAGIGEEEDVLTSMIPALESLLGKPQGKRDATFGGVGSRSEARQLFDFAFRKLIRVICSSKRPVVLLLDNLQYADPSPSISLA
jgi:predicted ATPase